MKKRGLLLIILTVLLCSKGDMFAQITVDVRSNGFTFSPDEILVSPGDTVNFNIGSFHDAVEVSEETWNASDTTYNGGFRLPFGGGRLVLEELGTYYFVCTPHASLGMKGIIFVQEPTSVTNVSQEQKPKLEVFPNPVSDNINLLFDIEKSTKVTIELFDLNGRIVKQLLNAVYESGIYNETYYIDNLKPGRYVVNIRTNTGNKAKSLIIVD